MEKIEKLIKEYSSKKLKEIIEEQSSSYSEKFIDYAKDEMIRRGENFQLDENLKKEISEMQDGDLKNLVEKEHENFHLEYLEIARKEYLKRGFKNEIGDDDFNEQEKTLEKRYPALRTIASIYSVFAWIIGIVTVIAAIFSLNAPEGLMIAVLALVVGSLIVLGVLVVSESIKVFIDIEENTRKESD